MYTREQALAMGRSLDELGWEFFEAPLPDADFNGYGMLTEALALDVVCGGNDLPDLRLIELALEMGVWDRVRFDATGIGGVTGGNRAMAIARNHGRKCEVQSWGYTLTQAANLHLILAHENCDYFEQGTPVGKYEFGARQVVRPDAGGLVRPSGLPGLGVEPGPGSDRARHLRAAGVRAMTVRIERVERTEPSRSPTARGSA